MTEFVSEYMAGFLDGMKFTAALRFDPNNLQDFRELLMVYDRVDAGYGVPERVLPRFSQTLTDWRDEWERLCRHLGPARPMPPRPAPETARKAIETQMLKDTCRPERTKKSKVGRYKKDFLTMVQEEMNGAKSSAIGGDEELESLAEDDPGID